MWRTWPFDENVWWTPKQNPASLSEAQETSGLAALVPADVTLRFNNSDHVLAERIPELISFAATAGAALVVLVCGLVGVSIGERKQCEGGQEAGT